MILQHILIQNPIEKETLYLRKEGAVEFVDGIVCLEKGAKVRFDTYFGSFSAQKWQKYTDAGEVSLHVMTEGEFLLDVYCRQVDGNENKILSETISGEVEIPLSGNGVVWFSLAAKTDGKLLEADYRAENAAPREIKICAVICTYKREEFVNKNIAVLRSLAQNDLAGRLTTIVVDNGNTLPVQNDGSVNVIANKNAGGAGGFTRGLIETMRIRETEKITHVLLMDDDVSFDPETIRRTHAFLSLLKPEFSDVFLSGGMLRLDQPTIQSESSDFWDFSRGAVVPRKHNFDLSDFDFVVKNEEEDPINYSSWWYCAMPADVPQEDNLPLPLFIKRDDVEYGLRNGKTFVTLNGIAVWHEPFEKKRPAALEYYYIRNRLVMDFSLGKARSKKYYAKYFLRETLLSCLRFRYNEATSLLAGAEDFCKGTDWLKSVDPTEKNDETRKYNAVLTPVSDEQVAACAPVKTLRGKKGKILRILTANGWLLPSKKTVLAPLARPSYKLFFGAKRALNYDPETKTGYYTERKISSLASALKQYRRVKSLFSKRYDALLADYTEHGQELRSLSFWTNYLRLDPKESA